MDALTANWPLVIVGLLAVGAALRALNAIQQQVALLQQQVELMQGGLPVEGGYQLVTLKHTIH